MLYAYENKIGMSISCNEHRTTINYCGYSRTWLCLNPNQAPFREIPFNKLTDWIFTAHSSEKKLDQLAISIRIYSLNNKKSCFLRIINKINQSTNFIANFTLTPKKILQTHFNGNTLLHLAAIYNHLPNLQYFLETLKISPNLLNIENNTPLHLAAKINHTKSVKFLLLLDNINKHPLNLYQETPLYLAAKYGHHLIVTQFLQHLSLDEFNNSESIAPIIIAATKNHLPVLQAFNQHKIDITQKDKQGETIMDHAKKHEYHEMIAYLTPIFSLKIENTPRPQPENKGFLFFSFKQSTTSIKRPAAVINQPQHKRQRLCK